MLDDQDFKAKVTRTEFEEMCADLFDEIEQVVKDALTSSEFTMVSWEIHLIQWFTFVKFLAETISPPKL